MNQYSNSSRRQLETCHPDLKVVFTMVLMDFDHTILCGHRNQEDQDEAYRTGHSKVRWPNGAHNSTPSRAVDVAPYPIDWKDRERFTYFAGQVVGLANHLYRQGYIDHRIRWGGDWDSDTEVADNGFDDLVHFELMEGGEDNA